MKPHIAKIGRKKTRLRGRGMPAKSSSVGRLYELQYGLCWICLKPMGEDFTRDHILPYSKGGGLEKNILLAHAKCNNKRGAPDILDKDQIISLAFQRIKSTVEIRAFYS